MFSVGDIIKVESRMFGVIGEVFDMPVDDTSFYSVRCIQPIHPSYRIGVAYAFNSADEALGTVDPFELESLIDLVGAL